MAGDMKLLDFFEKIHPAGGLKCLVDIKNGKVHSNFYDDVNEMLRVAGGLSEQSTDVYFGVASFKNESAGRKQSNALYARSFWLDLDCGENKEFASQHDARMALSKFCDQLKLPTPIEVSSGNGIHVYWPLTSDVPIEQWTKTATMLKQACVEFDFPADPSATADSARILRVPGTYNFKDPNEAKEVDIIDAGDSDYALSIQEFTDCLTEAGFKPKKEVSATPRRMSAATEALMGKTQHSFKKIARLSLSGHGCNFIKRCIQKQGSTDEPQWRAVLSIARACTDWETAIYQVSERHPEFSKTATLEKANQTSGPYRCDTIRNIAPEACKGCKLRIASPIAIAPEVVPVVVPPIKESKTRKPTEIADDVDGKPLFLGEAASTDNIDVDKLAEGGWTTSKVENPETGQEDEDEDDYSGDPSRASYSPPFPYVRSGKGGVFIRLPVKTPDGEESKELEDVMVYENDFYPTMRLMDKINGESIVFKVHLPQDGVREFTVPLRDVSAPDKFKLHLATNGIAATTKQQGELQMYSIKYIKDLQKRYKSTDARMQFGWHDDNKTLVIGTRAYTRDGTVEYNPASSTTGSIIQAFEPKGSLVQWKKVINALAADGLEPLQVSALTGFAAPLMKFSGINGCTVNLLSNDSGTGKTTAQLIGLSVMGDPYEQLLIENDTLNMRLHRMGVMGNFMVAVDEATNSPAEVISDMVYMTTQGRGRGRMRSDVNLERENTTVWQLPVVTSSNASMRSKLEKLKARPDGEMMRLLEYAVEKVEIPHGAEIFSLIRENHGVAGEVYNGFLVQNLDECIAIMEKERQALIKDIGQSSAERFWVAYYAAVLAGAIISQGLGLHDINIAKLRKWIIAQITGTRETVESSKTTSQNLIGEFLNQHINSIIGVGGKLNPMTGTTVFHQPRGSRVVARFESESKRMFISTTELRDFCVERQFTMDDVLSSCNVPNADYKFKGKVSKRMMSGTGINIGPVQAFEFECADDVVADVKHVLTSDKLEP